MSGELPAPGPVLAEGKRDALMILGAIAADDDDAERLAASLLKGSDGYAVIYGVLSLLVEALAEHGTGVAEWVARKQDEDALADAGD